MRALVRLIHRAIRLTRLDRIVAFCSGRYGFLIRLVPLKGQYGRGDRVRVSRDGVLFSLDRSDYIQWHVFANIPEYSWRVAFDSLPDGATVFDVGANVGMFSLKLARKCQESGKTVDIYSLEPNPPTFERLRRNLELNRELSPSIHLNEIALGDRAGFLELAYDEDNTGGASMISVDAARSNPTVATVRMETLDQFLFDNDITRVDFIKIDVEGYEPLVLEGARRTIESFAPVLYIEMTNEWFMKNGHSNSSVLRFLQERHNYSFFIMNGADRVELHVGDPVDGYPQFDLVAFPS